MELTPEFREKYVEVVDGRDFISYEGLRELAHKYIQESRVELVAAPDKDNPYAVVKVTIHDSNGRTWDALGDASPETCVPELAPHYLRLAETRAKGRAMRDMLNLDMLMLEEVFPKQSNVVKTESFAVVQGAPLTQEQVHRIEQIMQTRNISKEDALKELQRVLNKSSLRDLTAAEADIYIEELLRYKKIS